MAIKGSEFHVVLGNMKLSRESEQRISSAIQAAVLSELAAYKPNPDDPGNPFGPKVPGGGGPHPHIVLRPEWLGIIMHRLEGLRELEGVTKELEKIGQQRFF